MLVCLALPAVAVADDEEFDHSKQYSHKGQFGLSAGGGAGFRFISTYDKGIYCGQTSTDGSGEPKKVCTGRSPTFLDLGISFGVSTGLELVIDMRLGLEQDFGAADGLDGPKQFAIAPGLRLYVRDAGLLKFFSSFQLVIDSTDYDQPDVASTDYGLRNNNGLMFDFHRTVGVYFFFGETVSFRRWFHFDLFGGIGIQARVP